MREPEKTFEGVIVWQKAHPFVPAVSRVSRWPGILTTAMWPR